MSKKVILSLLIFFVCIFGGIAYAADNPFQGLAQDQVIQKYFTGRTLDPIEGIWVRDEKLVLAIVKTSVVPIQDSQKYDYVVILISENGEINSKLTKTKYDFSFKNSKFGNYWKLLSPNVLEFGVVNGFPVNPSETYVRIYPATAEIK